MGQDERTFRLWLTSSVPGVQAAHGQGTRRNATVQLRATVDVALVLSATLTVTRRGLENYGVDSGLLNALKVSPLPPGTADPTPGWLAARLA